MTQQNTYYKRPYRSTNDKIVGGVCAGLADYFAIDPIFVRGAFLIACFGFGLSIFAYIILWIFLPKNETYLQMTDYDPNIGENNYANVPPPSPATTPGFKPYENNYTDSKRNAAMGGYILVGLGILFLINNFTDIDFGKLWPVILIVVGAAILLKQVNENKNTNHTDPNPTINPNTNTNIQPIDEKQ
jgi:phage shock protein PspC (stress-responsive transcriptional regulator)